MCKTILDFHPARQKTANEWASACPACGGNDRFIIFPNEPKGGRYFCRGCGTKGDAIDYLRKFENMSYNQAFEALGVSTTDAPAKRILNEIKTQLPQKQEIPQPKQWNEAAQILYQKCQKNLEMPEALAFLKTRNIKFETALECCLGWSWADTYPARHEWGLSTVTGREKLLIPKGLVVFTKINSHVVAVNVRRSEWAAGDTKPKYWQVAGARNVPFVLGQRGLPVILVESALGAVLTYQEACRPVATIALNGSCKAIAPETDSFIKSASKIICVPDFDEAGKKAWQSWKSLYRDAILHPPLAKDVGAMPFEQICPWLNLILPLPERNKAPELILKPDIKKVKITPTITQKAIISQSSTVNKNMCFRCPKWLKKAGSAWWIGVCGENFRDVSFRSTCQFGRDLTF